MAGLEGKVALVTGAGGMRGVGRATVMKLAGLGADIALTDVHRETEDLPPAEVRTAWRGIDAVSEEVEAAGQRAFPTYCDLGDAGQIERMVEQVMNHYGRIDILVNNARAIIGRDKVSVTELEQEVWEHFLRINATAPYLLTKEVGRRMIEAGNGGRIVNIASNASKQASATGAAYSASKFAVLGLTQASALDLAPLRHHRQRRLPRPHQHRPHELLGARPSRRAGHHAGRVPQPDSPGRRPVQPLGPHRRAAGRRQRRRLPRRRRGLVRDRASLQRQRRPAVPLGAFRAEHRLAESVVQAFVPVGARHSQVIQYVVINGDVSPLFRRPSE